MRVWQETHHRHPSCVAETALRRKWAVQVPNSVAGKDETSMSARSSFSLLDALNRSSHPAASGTAFRVLLS